MEFSRKRIRNRVGYMVSWAWIQLTDNLSGVKDNDYRHPQLLCAVIRPGWMESGAGCTLHTFENSNGAVSVLPRYFVLICAFA